MHLYRKKTITLLLIILLIFFLIFIWAFYSLLKQKAVIGMGLPYHVENYMVLVLCFLSIIRIVIEIIRVEHKEVYEDRIKNLSL